MSEWSELIPKPRSRFIQVKCPDCGYEQVIFGNATVIVKCNVCDAELAKPSGGRAKIRGEIVDIFE
ncbi:MAG: 30S ribosomal protein S27e [Candidatus Bathyarchaeota archaeon]|nr:MAG: 30S ribosomal protein S27e [Candidatus Bathyarchaeota archaeon]